MPLEGFAPPTFRLRGGYSSVELQRQENELGRNRTCGLHGVSVAFWLLNYELVLRMDPTGFAPVPPPCESGVLLLELQARDSKKRTAGVAPAPPGWGPGDLLLSYVRETLPGK